jgi:trehalose/maltose hydrolase-like predicted phosphorylase
VKLSQSRARPRSGSADGARRSTFLLTTTDPTYRTPAVLGNGFFSLVGSPLGTTPAHSFAAGIYDRAPGDVPRIAAIPAWNAFNVSDGDGWLNDARPDPSALQSYRQTLDMRDGTLHTAYDWVHGVKRTSVEIVAFVSRADPNLAVVRLTLTPRYAGRVTVTFPLQDWPLPRRIALAHHERWDPTWTLATVWYPGHMTVTARGSAWLTARVDGGTTTVAVAQSVSSTRRPTVQASASEISFDASAGVAVTFTKLVGIAVARDGSEPLPRARSAIRRAAALGYRVLLAKHAAAWHRLWETDVIVEGDPALQRVVHAMLFYLLSSVRQGSGESIPPMGLSSAGYCGHVFWDADTWMFPALAVLHPAIARSIVAFRVRTLGAAKQNARANGRRGAMYPWESDERGEETTPRWASQNALAEIHVTGDVAIAQWQYYLATGDTSWLERNGYPVIKETADFWVSRVRYDSAAHRYEIRDVVSVDEDLIGVGNDAYTNAVARKNLEIAVAASRRLDRVPNPRWARVAALLYIPYDPAGEYHQTYEGAPPHTGSSVVPLLAFPLALPMSERAKRNDLTHAVRRLGKHGGGAMMTLTLYPIIAAELGDRELVDDLLQRSYQEYLRGPFHVLAETPNNDAVNFITGAAGFLQQVIFGYTGLRLGDDGLRAAFKPVLPSRVRRLVLRNVSVRGKRKDFVVETDRARFVSK